MPNAKRAIGVEEILCVSGLSCIAYGLYRISFEVMLLLMGVILFSLAIISATRGNGGLPK